MNHKGIHKSCIVRIEIIDIIDLEKEKEQLNLLFRIFCYLKGNNSVSIVFS